MSIRQRLETTSNHQVVKRASQLTSLDTNDQRLTICQATGKRIRLKVQSRDRLENSLTYEFSDRSRIIHDSRTGVFGDVRVFGDILRGNLFLPPEIQLPASGPANPGRFQSISTIDVRLTTNSKPAAQPDNSRVGVNSNHCWLPATRRFHASIVFADAA